MLSKLRKSYMSSVIVSDGLNLTSSVISDGSNLTSLSKAEATGAAIDINRNTESVSFSTEVEQYVDAGDCARNTRWNNTAVQHSVNTSDISSDAVGSSLQLLQSVPNGTSPTDARPILRPPKKRRINLTPEDSTDRCIEPCRTAQFSEVSLPPVSRTDLSEWRGHRVLARHPTSSVYCPGLVKHISTSDGPIGIQFDGNSDKIIQTSPENVISDSAPPSSGISVGMSVCARIGSDQVVEVSLYSGGLGGQEVAIL